MNSDTFVMLYYNPQMTQDNELMSFHAESSCQLFGGEPFHAQYPVIRLTSHFSCGMSFFLQDLVLIPYGI